MKVLYICSANIATFSENSNAYQQPYNLCLNSSCTIIAKSKAVINDEIKNLAHRIIYTDLYDTRLSRFSTSKVKRFYNEYFKQHDDFDVIICDFSEWATSIAKQLKKIFNLSWYVLLWDPPFYNRYEIKTGLVWKLERALRLRLYNNTIADATALCFINSGVLAEEQLKFKRFHQLKNGVDLSLIDSIVKTQILKRKQSICNIGRVRMDKGCMEILKAFEFIGAEFPNATLKFVGQIDGTSSEKEKIKRAVETHPYVERIHITGRIPFLSAMNFVAECEIGLHAYSASKYLIYNHLLKIGEYQALGLVPISVRYPGTLDLIEDKKTGIFIKNNEGIFIYEALKEILADNNLYEKISVQARFEVRKRSWAAVTNQMLNIVKVEVYND
ncbi:glycosyltransferase [Mucilaginibacter limnophilus]|uniref:Glycosyltransferase n=1 Tax=Mucilaginibacter limnophilus TaxID=1932778 RepID=A0A437MQ31_9SPHI|nr:glycosyltransferase [Mucilaginibacter limnophilus]RVT99753.1 glycosyltransferase [Mucilaginibacter limnophilus]